jgi:hypothetical protein
VNDHHEFGCARIDPTVVALQRTYLRITRAVGNAKFLIQNLLVASPTAGVRSLFLLLIETLVYTDRIVELGATPSTGTVGDSFDNALAEAVNGLYKTELLGCVPVSGVVSPVLSVGSST